MKRRKNSQNEQYYLISNPTSANINTGKFCISVKYVTKFDKDFLFDWEDPTTGIHYKKILNKRYVINHCKPCPRWVLDEFTGIKEKRGMFYLITLTDIINY